MTPFPWAGAMRLGLGILRLPPEAFWKMTPRELAAAASVLGGAAGTPPLKRARLDELAKRYPDTDENNG